jgi:hypothetical protein
VRWPLQRLLDLRRWEEADAAGALGRALVRRRAAEAEARALRGAATEIAARALRCWGPGRRGDDAGLRRPGGSAPGDGAVLAAAAACAARLRLDAARASDRADRAEARVLAEASEVEGRRAWLRGAALRRAVVERLEASWRRAREAEAARRAEAALDDRPWTERVDPAIRAVSACRPAAARPVPARTGA